MYIYHDDKDVYISIDGVRYTIKIIHLYSAPQITCVHITRFNFATDTYIQYDRVFYRDGYVTRRYFWVNSGRVINWWGRDPQNMYQEALFCVARRLFKKLRLRQLTQWLRPPELARLVCDYFL